MEDFKKLIIKSKIELNDILQQLNKDLLLSGIDTDYFNDIESLEILHDKLIFFVEEMLQYKQDLFSNFIYRIDLPENKIYNNKNSLQKTFAKAILIRIAQKIYFRKNFSK